MPIDSLDLPKNRIFFFLPKGKILLTPRDHASQEEKEDHKKSDPQRTKMSGERNEMRRSNPRVLSQKALLGFLNDFLTHMVRLIDETCEKNSVANEINQSGDPVGKFVDPVESGPGKGDVPPCARSG